MLLLLRTGPAADDHFPDAVAVVGEARVVAEHIQGEHPRTLDGEDEQLLGHVTRPPRSHRAR